MICQEVPVKKDSLAQSPPRARNVSTPSRHALGEWTQRGVVAVAVAAGAYACSSSSSGGTGGAGETGGAEATGGSATGGAVTGGAGGATGGAKATGGMTATGGMKATGGAQVLTYTVSGDFETTPIQKGNYFFQNDVWNAKGQSGMQVVEVTGLSFVVKTFTYNANGDTPVSFPSFVKGCHYSGSSGTPANCTEDTSLPKQISALGSVMTSMQVSPPGGGKWDASYDIWLDPTKASPLQNKTEIMVWLDWSGCQPLGSMVGNVTVGGVNYELWHGNIGWEVASFRRTDHVHNVTFDVKPLIDAVVQKGWAQNSWYLNSVEAGFEGWSGLAGAKVDSFSVDAK